MSITRQPHSTLSMRDYDLLDRDIADWRHAPAALRPASEEEESLVLAESECLDEGDYAGWLSLYAAHCLYWVPATSRLVNPRDSVCMACDDRRRMEDKVFWLTSEPGPARYTPTATSRLLGRPARVPSSVPGETKIRTRILVHATRGEREEVFAGWTGHVLTAENDRTVIVRKVVCLADPSRGWRGMQIFL